MLTDAVIATQVNDGIKHCITDCARSASETANPQLRAAFAQISQDGIRRQAELAQIMQAKGWYTPPRLHPENIQAIMPQLQALIQGTQQSQGLGDFGQTGISTFGQPSPSQGLSSFGQTGTAQNFGGQGFGQPLLGQTGAAQTFAGQGFGQPGLGQNLGGQGFGQPGLGQNLGGQGQAVLTQGTQFQQQWHQPNQSSPYVSH